MKELPENLRHDAEALISKYKGKGWTDINIGPPDWSDSPNPNIFLYATHPRGERLVCIVSQGPNAFQVLSNFLDSN